jgi:transketolase
MSFLSETDIVQLQLHANSIRQTVVEMLAKAGSGHTAGSLDMADIFSALYFYILQHDPKNPEWEDRDRLIVSNGHIAPVRYASMAHSGYFPLEDVYTLRAFGSPLQGHPERTRMAGLETTSGPLGEGLSQAAGIALGARMDAKDFHTYCVMSDGEHQCGLTWEAIMFVANMKLTNVTAIVDRNNIQISGRTEDVMPLEPLRDKYEAFGWNVLSIDGHDVEVICDAVEQAKAEKDKPTVILANTLAGKGIASIEGKYEWHGKVPSEKEAEAWIQELHMARKAIAVS